MYRSIFLVIFVFLAELTLAQTENDSLKSEFKEELEQVEDNLDSLLTTWYVKKSINNNNVIKNNKDVDHHLNLPDSVYINRLEKIPTTFPLVYNDKVNKWIEMYLKRGKYLIPTFLGMGEYYFPIFEEVLDANDIPLELKYLPIVESALNPRAVSRAGATGLWQFMYSTGKMYNLEISTLVDERKDPIKSTHAAARFLKDLYNIYGDWALVIAAYNCGPGNVNKAIRRSGGKTNFWEIYQHLPRETRGYVPAFISVTYVMNYYKEHNFSPIEIQLPVHTDTLMVDKKLHLMQVAEVMDIPIEQLRDMNPQYRKDIVPGNIQSYSLKLPFEYSTNFIDIADSIYAYKDSFYFDPKNVIIEPPEFKNTYASSYSSPCNPDPGPGMSKLTYTVKSGDTFGFIANWYDVSVRDLKCWNNKRSDRLSIGQKLTVYVPTKKLNKYKNVNRLSFDKKQHTVSNKIITSSKRSNKPLDKNYFYYTIKSGDNLSTIAKKYNGISDKDLMRINGFSSSDVRRLQIGQVIKIRRK